MNLRFVWCGTTSPTRETLLGFLAGGKRTRDNLQRRAAPVCGAGTCPRRPLLLGEGSTSGLRPLKPSPLTLVNSQENTVTKYPTEFRPFLSRVVFTVRSECAHPEEGPASGQGAHTSGRCREGPADRPPGRSGGLSSPLSSLTFPLGVSGDLTPSTEIHLLHSAGRATARDGEVQWAALLTVARSC